MNSKVRLLCLIPGLLFMVSILSASDGSGLPSPELTVEGRAAIYHEDISGARERATQAALVRALERYAGMRIEASTLIKKGELIDREVRAHTFGWIQSWEFISERREGPELVIQVKVKIAAKPVEESLRAFLPATTTLLLISESNLSKPVEGQIVTSVLSDPFFTASVVVPPASTLKTARRKVSAAYYRQPDPDISRELGLKFLSGFIIVGWADTRALDTSVGSLGYDVDPSVLRPVVAAEGNLSILDGQNGKLIVSRHFADIRASDASDPERAGRKALDLLADQMKSFLTESLAKHIRALGFPLRVVVTGSQAADGAPRVRQILEDTRWVKSVEIEKEEPGKTVLLLSCREKPVYVVEELRQAEGIRVSHFDGPAGEVKVQ